MIAKAFTSALSGIDGIGVTIETDLSNGLPSFDIVGLPDAAVKEAKERVSAAIRNSGFELPPRKIVVNLAPADIRKEGSGFDLGIALSLLAADEKIPAERLSGIAFFGELSLSGEIKHVNGILSLGMSAAENGLHEIVVPADDALEASMVDGITVYGARTLYEVFSHLTGGDALSPLKSDAENLLRENRSYALDFADVKGQPRLKLGMEIAAAGGHNILIMGAPGSGKSMLAKRLPTILPDLTVREAIETTRIYSAAGMLDPTQPLLANRPFRSPHHNISIPGLIGGGTDSKPGEISLSHNGVLFLDEFLEFPPKAMESLRQPLEDGRVTISRVNASNTYPCKMTLVLAANPCPCGYYGDPTRRCTCSSTAVSRYLSKMSGPLLDRIDVQVEAESMELDALSGGSEESSDVIRARVNAARKIQRERYQSDTKLNSDLKTKEELDRYCPLDEQTVNLFADAYKMFRMSIRGYHSLIAIARTIADLQDSENIQFDHAALALSFRRLEHKYWNR